MEKVNITTISTPAAPPNQNLLLLQPLRDGDGGWPTCAAHSAVQMRAHFPAAHFVDVISSSVNHSPLQPAAPGRHSGAHRILRSGHPGVCFVPRVKRTARLDLPVNAPLIGVFLLSGTSPPNFSLAEPHGGGKKKKSTQGRVRLQTLCHKPGPLLFCLVRWTGELSAAPSRSVVAFVRSA